MVSMLARRITQFATGPVPGLVGGLIGGLFGGFLAGLVGLMGSGDASGLIGPLPIGLGAGMGIGPTIAIVVVRHRNWTHSWGRSGACSRDGERSRAKPGAPGSQRNRGRPHDRDRPRAHTRVCPSRMGVVHPCPLLAGLVAPPTMTSDGISH